jgi:hypothetical protein
MFKKIFVAVCLVASVGFAAPPASAEGYRHGHHWRGHGQHYGYGHRRYYGHKSYRHYDGAAFFAGGLLLGALVGHLATAPRAVYAPPPPALGNCRVIYGTRWINGRLAEYSGTGCYDAYGTLYAMPGSERFLGYID